MFFNVVTPILNFIAFLLLLLVSLSVPIINNIFLLALSANVESDRFDAGASGSVDFGIWGYCISPITVTVFGIDRVEEAECTPSQLGYDIDNRVSEILNISDSQNAIIRSLTMVLVLHPIACGLTFLALVTSILVAVRPRRLFALTSLIFTGFASLITTIIFVLDIVFIALTRNRLNDIADGSVNTSFGNAVWMVLGATIALWAASVGACATLLRGRRANPPLDKY